MTHVEVREFRYPGDYAGAIELWRTAGEGIHVGPSDAPDEIKKKLRRDPDLFLVAEVDGRLVGTVVGAYDGRRGHIYHLAVALPFRRQGVASRLMEEVELRLRRKGCIRCHLLVRDRNEAAKRHYERNGWQRLDDFPYAKDLV